jgi:hypothetical protein
VLWRTTKMAAKGGRGGIYVWNWVNGDYYCTSYITC